MQNAQVNKLINNFNYIFYIIIFFIIIKLKKMKGKENVLLSRSQAKDN